MAGPPSPVICQGIYPDIGAIGSWQSSIISNAISTEYVTIQFPEAASPLGKCQGVHHLLLLQANGGAYHQCCLVLVVSRQHCGVQSALHRGAWSACSSCSASGMTVWPSPGVAAQQASVCT